MTTTQRSGRNIIATRFMNTPTVESAFPYSKHLLNFDACFAMGLLYHRCGRVTGLVNVVRIHGRNGYALHLMIIAYLGYSAHSKVPFNLLLLENLQIQQLEMNNMLPLL